MLERLTQVSLVMAGLGLLLMMIMIVADVGAKYVFTAPISGVLEMVAYYFMTIVVFFPLAYVEQSRQHLMIELFSRSFSPANIARLDVFAGIVSFAYLGLFAWGTIQQARYVTEINYSAEILDFNLLVWPSLWILPFSILLMMAWTARHTFQKITVLFHSAAAGSGAIDDNTTP